MKYLILIICLWSYSINAQFSVNKKKLDSLITIVKKTKDDTTKVILYHLICKEYEQKDLKNLIFYNNKLQLLSKKINYKRGEGFYYYHLTSIYSNSLDKKIVSSTRTANIFFKINDLNNFLLCRYDLAFALMSKAQHDKAKEVINQSLKIALKTNQYKSIGNFYRLLGLINYYQASLNSALFNYKKSIYFYDKDKTSTKNKNDLYLYIAYIYTDLSQFKESLYYLNLANNDNSDVSINIEKAVVLNKLSRYNQALKLLLLNNKLITGYNESVNYYNSYILSQTYYYLKKYTAAITILKKIKYEKNVLEIRLEYYILLANCYFKLNKIEEAKKYNNQCLVLVDSSNMADLKQEVFLTKSTIEENSANLKLALLYYKKYVYSKEMNDIKINEDKVRELQTEFNLTDKENKIKSLQLAQLQKGVIIKTQKNYIIYGAVFLVLALLSFFIFIKFIRTVKQKNAIISIKNIDLENAYQTIEESLEIKETLLKEIHHRVKNNLQLVMSLLNIQSQEANNNIENFIEVSQSRIASIALVHENLYKTKNLSKVDFKEYLNNLTDSILNTYVDLKNNIDLKINVVTAYLDIETAIPLGLIINELIQNAYKHAFDENQKGIIEIILLEKDSVFELKISDNGNGFAVNKELNKTLGIELVELLVGQIKGNIKMINHQGVSYTIQFKNNSI